MENKIKSVFTAPLNFMNPVLVQVLGICSALAVTSQLKPALVMGLAVTVITAFSNLIISLIRNTVPTRIRIAKPVNEPLSGTIDFWDRWADAATAAALDNAVESCATKHS